MGGIRGHSASLITRLFIREPDWATGFEESAFSDMPQAQSKPMAELGTELWCAEV